MAALSIDIKWWHYAVAAGGFIGLCAVLGKLTSDGPNEGQTAVSAARAKRSNARGAARGSPAVMATEDQIRSLISSAEDARRERRYEDAENFYNEVLRTMKREFGPEHLLVAVAHQALSNVHVDMCEFEKAEKELHEAKRVMQQNNVPLQQFAEIDTHLSSVLLRARRLNEAEECAHRAARALEAWPDGEDTASMSNEVFLVMARIKHLQRNFDEAITLCDSAVKKLAKSHSTSPELTWRALLMKGQSLLQAGRTEEAVAVFEQLGADAQRVPADRESTQRTRVALQLSAIGSVCFDLKHYDLALTFNERALQAVDPQARPVRLGIELDIASAHFEVGHYDTATLLLDKLRAEYESEGLEATRAVSNYLTTESYSVDVSSSGAVSCTIKLGLKADDLTAPTPRLPAGAVLDARFENAVDPTAPFSQIVVIDNAVRASKRPEVTITSALPGWSTAASPRKAVLVDIFIYADESRRQQIGRHRQFCTLKK